MNRFIVLRVGNIVLALYYTMGGQLAVEASSLFLWENFQSQESYWPLKYICFEKHVESEQKKLLTRPIRHICQLWFCGSGKVVDRGTMLGLSESWRPVGFHLASRCHQVHPPAEITNKASTGVLARDCCWDPTSLYLQMADEPKIRLEFLQNFVCLLSIGRPGFGSSPNPIHSNTDFFSGRFWI